IEVYQTQRADECFIDVDCPAQCTCHGTVVDCRHWIIILSYRNDTKLQIFMASTVVMDGDNNKGLTEVPGEIPHFATELYLNRNRISIVSAASGLSKLRNLLKLDLSFNNIIAVEEGSLADMKSLRDLLTSALYRNLSHNKLRHFFSAVLGSSNILEVLQIGGNDLPCDCQVLPLVEWMRANATRTVEAGQCTRPAEMLGKNLDDLKKENMKCSDIVQSACAGNGDYCPVGCTCQDTVVRCSNKVSHS
ncbi:unnamed protein product, partial [Strongylus vulgaris]